MTMNLVAAWIGFFCGCIAGVIPGLFFHSEGWLDGYASWRRRMIRLAHIAFFGIGLLNIAFVVTARALEIQSGLTLPALSLVVGAVAMPTVCYLSAWKKPFRHLFFIPASAVTIGVASFLYQISLR
jgi:hypothetical protein